MACNFACACMLFGRLKVCVCVAPGPPQERPRGPKTPPRVPKEAPRGIQECSRRLQEGLKRPKEPVKRTNSFLKSFFVWHVILVNALSPYCMSEKQANFKNAQLRCRATEWRTGMPKHGGRAAVSPQSGRQSAARTGGEGATACRTVE